MRGVPPVWWSPGPEWPCGATGIPAGLNEGVERVFVAGVGAGQPFPVGRTLGHVGSGCTGFRLRVGLRWAPWQCLPGCGVPRCTCVAAVCWGRGWGGSCGTCGLRPVVGWWGEASGMLGVWRRSPRSCSGTARVRCLAIYACCHVRRPIGRHAGVPVFWMARHPARYLCSGWSPGG